MNTQVTVVVDVREELTRSSGDELLGVLGGLQGIWRASVSSHARRLVLVEYDPKVTDSLSILGAVTNRGFDARLIGL